MQLFNQTNAWPLAVAAYHSQTPEIGADYARKVLAAWGVPQPPAGSQIVAAAAAVPAPAPAGRVAVLLPNGNDAIRVLPLATPGAAAPAMTARGLDAYRATPVTLSSRMPHAF